MKKWTLSELFSEMSFPEEKLPEISCREDISYKNIQKRVFDKLESRETIPAEPDSNSANKRIIIGFGLVAVLCAGGFGMLSPSTAGSRGLHSDSEETIEHETIDQSFTEYDSIVSETITTEATKKETKTEAVTTTAVKDTAEERLSDAYNAQQSLEAYCPDFVYFNDAVYDFDDNIEEINIESIKLCQQDDKTYIMVHLAADRERGFTFDEIDREQLLKDCTLSKKVDTAPVAEILSDKSDSENAYLVYMHTSAGLSASADDYCFRINGLKGKGYKEYSLLDIQSYLGFTDKDISSGRDFTYAEMEQIAREYTVIPWTENESFCKKSEVISDSSITAQISAEDGSVILDGNYSNIVPIALNALSDAPVAEWSVSDKVEFLRGEVICTAGLGELTEIFIRFTAEEAGQLQDGSLFDEKTFTVYTVNPDTGLHEKRDDITFRTDSYTDGSSTTIKLETDRSFAENERLRLSFRGMNLHFRAQGETGSFKHLTENGEMIFDIAIGSYLSFPETYIEEAFVTEDGFNISSHYNGDELVFYWNYEDAPLPQVFDGAESLNDEYQSYGTDRFHIDNRFRLVTKSGFEYPIRFNIAIDSANKAVQASAYTYSLDPEYKEGGFSAVTADDKAVFISKNPVIGENPLLADLTEETD